MEVANAQEKRVGYDERRVCDCKDNGESRRPINTKAGSASGGR